MINAIKSFPNYIRTHFEDSQRFFIVCLLAGVLCGFTAVSFHLVIDVIFHTIWSTAQSFSSIGFISIMILSPTIGGLIVGVILQKFPDARGSGIPQTKVSYFMKFGNIPLRIGVARFIAGCISIGSGASLGREGPTVHICSTVAVFVGRIFGLAKLRIQAMIPIGFGAGVAAAFNAPLSAIMFVFEELLGSFSSKAMGGIAVAVIIAAIIERSVLGENPIFNTSLPDFTIHYWMLIAIPIAFCAGFLGNYFVGFTLSLRQHARDLPIHEIFKPAIGGLAVGILGVIAYFITLQFSEEGSHGIFGMGNLDLNHVLDSKLLLGTIITLLIIKFFATSICYASGSSGGLFAPTLFLGGMLGGLFGGIIDWLTPLEQPVMGACALLGMGAMFGSVIRCPITSFLIIFEMTGNYSLILPLMASSGLAYYISTRIRKIPIYDALLIQDKISLKKLPSYQGQQDWQNLPISTIMSHDPICVNSEFTPKETLAQINEHGHVHHGYPVVTNEGKLDGMITHHELEEEVLAQRSPTIKQLIIEQDTVVVRPTESIRAVAKTLIDKDVLQVPVVSPKDATKLVGVVTLHDIARQQNAVQDIIQR